LLVIGGLVFSADVDDAIGVDIERHFHLRDTARSRRDAHQLEYAQQAVVLGHGALALVALDLDRGLAVGRRREHFALARRNGRVPLNELGEHAAQRLDAQRQRRDVEQQDVLDFAAQHAALHRGTHRDDFIGVHALVRLFAEQLAH